MRKRTAMILAAGMGTRLCELTNDKPKALVELNGSPLLKIVIEKLDAANFNHIVVNVHHFSTLIKSYLSDNHFENVEVSDETAQLMDTGGGILMALPLFSDSSSVLVHNVDVLSDVDLKALFDAFEQSTDDAWLLTQNRETNRKLLFDDENQLVGWKNISKQEYKWVHNEMNQYNEMAFSGLHLFRPFVFKNLELKPCSIIDLYLLQAKSFKIKSKTIEAKYWFDLGKKEEFQKVSDFFNNPKTQGK